MKISIVGSEGYLGTTLQGLLGGHELQRIDAGVWRDVGEGVIKERTARGIFKRLEKFQPDHVVWLAALAHDPAGRISTRAMDDNVAETPGAVIHDLCGELPCPVTAISSLSVFSPKGDYPRAKREMEKHITWTRNWFRYVNIHRFGTLFGGCGDPAAFRQHLLLNSMVRSALKEGVIRVSNPALRRPVLSVKEAAAIICEDILNIPARGQIFNHYDRCGTLQEYGQLVQRALREAGFNPRVEVQCKGPAPDERDYGWDGPVNEVMMRREIRGLATWLAQYEDQLPQNPLEAMYAWHDRNYA